MATLLMRSHMDDHTSGSMNGRCGIEPGIEFSKENGDDFKTEALDVAPVESWTHGPLRTRSRSRETEIIS